MLNRLIYLLWFKELINSSEDVVLDHLRPGLSIWACAYCMSNPVCSQHRIPSTSAGQTEPSAFQAARSGISTRKRAWDPWGQWGWEQHLFLSGFRWLWLSSTSTVCLVLLVNPRLALPCMGSSDMGRSVSATSHLGIAALCNRESFSLSHMGMWFFNWYFLSLIMYIWFYWVICLHNDTNIYR